MLQPALTKEAMKKAIIAMLLVLGSVGLFAQANSWYFAVLPGFDASFCAWSADANALANSSLRPLPQKCAKKNAGCSPIMSLCRATT